MAWVKTIKVHSMSKVPEPDKPEPNRKYQSRKHDLPAVCLEGSTKTRKTDKVHLKPGFSTAQKDLGRTEHDSIEVPVSKVNVK